MSKRAMGRVKQEFVMPQPGEETCARCGRWALVTVMCDGEKFCSAGCLLDWLEAPDE